MPVSSLGYILGAKDVGKVTFMVVEARIDGCLWKLESREPSNEFRVPIPASSPKPFKPAS